jgi:hypothetical protein
MFCPIRRSAAIVRHEADPAMTPRKPDPRLADLRAPVADDVLRALQSEMEALAHLLPGAALLLSPRAQPDDEAVENGFDNMPV